MKESRIVAVDHVHVEAAPQAVEALFWFYGELVGLDVLTAEPVDGLLRFKSEQIELRIRLCEEPRLVQNTHATTLLLPSLDDACAALAERRIPFQPLSAIARTDRRISLLDPGGNRVSLKQQWPYGLI